MLIHSVALSAGFSEIDSTINVNDLGVYGDGRTEQSDTLQGILDAYTNIYFPPGEYSINKSLRLRSHHQISGSDSTVLVPTGEGAIADEFSFFTIRSAQNIRLEQLTFYAEDNPERTVYAVSARNVHYFTIESVTAINCGVAAVIEQEGYRYAAIPDTLSSEAFRQVGNSHVIIRHCRGEGARQGLPRRTTGVLIQYADDWEITHCSFTRYRHGIQWWGGDSNPARDGALNKVRKCRNGLISHVRVDSVRQGGIWGSMGENITVEHCEVARCGDVGIDFEGCYRSQAVNNYVQESSNGNLAVFFYNRNIRFAHNRSVQSTPEYPHARIYNATQRPENGQITFDNNVFMNTQSVGYIDQRGPSNRIIFTQNSLHNVVVNFSFNNNKYVEIKYNTFLITRPLVSYAYMVKAGQTHYGGEVLIEKNHILTAAPQPDTVYAISLYQSDYNHSPTNRVIHNVITGLPRQVKTEWAGKNAGFAAKTYIQTARPLLREAVRKIDTGARTSSLYVNDKEWK